MTGPTIPRPTIATLLGEYDRALDHTDRLWEGLTVEEVHWRPDEEPSAIGWHLGHQAAVGHFMVRNLTSAEPSPDPELDALMDSATPERRRGDLPELDRLRRYRTTVAERLRVNVTRIADGQVGAPAQLDVVARTLLVALVNHEYQHSQWIGEVRSDALGHAPIPHPTSELLRTIDGYCVLAG